MATSFDLGFLQSLVDQGVIQRPQANQCVQAIDQRAASGAPVQAPQVVAELGFVDPARLPA
ncbi:MAG: hypothetical protein KDD82_15935, partial [Planctomycetes bacterium]|nr:hypothetical protein [Planctomycetota bacterium]